MSQFLVQALFLAHMIETTKAWANQALQPTRVGAGSSAVAGGAFCSRVAELRSLAVIARS